MKTLPTLHLLEFTIENYHSIREPVTLSLLAATKHDHDVEFTVATGGYRLLTAAVMYGANASGKSNIMRALFYYRGVIVGNSELFGDESIEPFMLDGESKTKDTTFEASFTYGSRVYMYGFQISATQKVVSREWLRWSNTKTKRFVTVYERSRDKVSVNSNLNLSQHGISQSFTKQLQSQELFITTLSRNVHATVAKEVVEAWKSCQVLNTLVHDPFPTVSKVLYEDPQVKDLVLPLMQEADPTIRDIRVTKLEIGYLTEFRHSYRIKNSTKSAWFDIKDQESSGTLKFFSFSLSLLRSLQIGTLMALDELGSSLHPDLLKYIVELFHSPAKNPHHAQLVLTTHDTNLMRGVLGRDQIYLVSKTQQQSTELYSLSDVKGIRKGRMNLDERYLRGDFGAVPDIVEG